MSDAVIKHLNRLSEIQPNRAFLASSRAQILAAPRGVPKTERIGIWQVFALPRFAFSVSVFVFAVAVVGAASAGGVFRAPVTVASLDGVSLSREIETLSIDLKLAEVVYNQRIEETVAMAVLGIATKQVQEAAPILETENSAVPTNLLDRDERIDVLLRDILF